MYKYIYIPTYAYMNKNYISSVKKPKEGEMRMGMGMRMSMQFTHVPTLAQYQHTHFK